MAQLDALIVVKEEKKSPYINPEYYALLLMVQDFLENKDYGELLIKVSTSNDAKKKVVDVHETKKERYEVAFTQKV